MATSVALHRVSDSDAWRKVYDALADVQRQGGVVEKSVYRMDGDPDNLLVTHRSTTMEQAPAFFDSDDLHRGM
jgi:hypothetical protein